MALLGLRAAAEAGGVNRLGKNLVEKIIGSHLVSGSMFSGSEVGIRIDQTLTQDSLAAMAYLQFEALGIPKVRTKLSVSYVDHLMFQPGEENADVHRYLESIADKYGIVFSRPGNGICHQVQSGALQPSGTLLAKTGVIKMVANWVNVLGVTAFVGVMLMLGIITLVLRLGVASVTAAAALFIPLAIMIGHNAGFTQGQLVALGWITYVFCRAGYFFPSQTASLMMT